MVRHIIPTSLKEALIYLGEGTFQVIAGGTDLMIQKRSSAGVPPKFVKDTLYIFNLNELKYVNHQHDAVHIGALTPIEDLLHHELTPALLKQVIGETASPAIRHVATLAGNIGNASPAGDALVALYLLDAKIKLDSMRGCRIMPIEEVIIGVRKTTMASDEMITEIIVPDHKFDSLIWRKVGGRQADAISKVSFAAACRLHHGVVADIRVAFGSVATTVARSRVLETNLIGRTCAEIRADLPAILDKFSGIISPINDQRSNAEYRQQVARNMLRDFF